MVHPLSASMPADYSFSRSPESSVLGNSQNHIAQSAFPVDEHDRVAATLQESENNRTLKLSDLPIEVLQVCVQMLPFDSKLNFALTCRYFNYITELQKTALNALEPYLACSKADQVDFKLPLYSQKNRELDHMLLKHFLFSQNGQKSLNADAVLKESIRSILFEAPGTGDLNSQENPKHNMALILRKYSAKLETVLSNEKIEKPLSAEAMQQKVLLPVQRQKNRCVQDALQRESGEASEQRSTTQIEMEWLRVELWNKAHALDPSRKINAPVTDTPELIDDLD